MFFDNNLPMLNFSSVKQIIPNKQKKTQHFNRTELCTLNFYKKSDAVLSFDEKKVHIHDNCIVLFPPAVNYCMQGKEKGISVRFFAINGFNAANSVPGSSIHILYPHIYSEYEQLFEELLAMYLSSNSGNIYRYNELLYRILYMMYSESDTLCIDAKTSVACRAAKYIECNLSNAEFSVNALANELNISAPHLRVLFKNEYGMSPKDYQINARMNLAKAILCDSSCSVSDISALCGFGSERYFSTIFKKYYGISPTQYRNMI